MLRDRARANRWLRGAAESLLILAAVTAAGRLLALNPTSAGFLFFLAVLFIASRQPLIVSTTAAVVATLSFNFFFLPPTGTLIVSDPSNWVSLAAFLVACIVANRLLVRERLQSERAEASRSEVQALYSLSVEALRAMGGLETIGEAAVRAVETVGARAGGLVMFGNSPQQQQVIAWSGAAMGDEVEDVIAGVGRHRRFTEIPSAYGRDVFVPLNAGEKIVGVLVVRGTEATRDGLESVGTLLSLVLERERFVAERAHVEALRETNELQNALLQAVSHDLNSPLTVLTLESEALLRGGDRDSAAHAAAIREQTAQLQRRINNLLSLARYRAGVVDPRKEPTPPADIFRSARENVSAIVKARPIQTTIAPDTPDAMIDPSLALEIMVNLIENAHRASPAESPIELRAFISPDDASRIRIEVADRGHGLTTSQQKSLRTRTLSDPAERRGLGIDVARTLAMLSGGSLEWFARDGGGTVARLDVPAARAGEIAEGA